MRYVQEMKNKLFHHPLYKENRFLTLNALLEKTEAKRQWISEYTGLSLGTVSNHTRELLKEKLVIKTGQQKSGTRGRSQDFLSLRADAGFVIGVNIKKTYIQITMANLREEEVFCREEELDSTNQLTVAHSIRRAVRRLMELEIVPESLILNLAISYPGTLSPETGIVFSFPDVGKWEPFFLGENISSQFHVPVSLYTDVLTGLIGEKASSFAGQSPNLVYVSLDDILRYAVMLKGKIVAGLRGSSSGIGHITVKENGRECYCGNHGCFETVLDASDEDVGYYLAMAITKFMLDPEQRTYQFPKNHARLPDCVLIETKTRNTEELEKGISKAVPTCLNTRFLSEEQTKELSRKGIVRLSLQRAFYNANTGNATSAYAYV